MNKRFTALFSVILIMSVTATGVRSQSITNTLDRYFRSLVESHGFNGNVLVADHGRIVYQKSFGYADLSTKRLNTQTSVFPIASITKTFTATAILQLQEKGKLHTNDLVKHHLPGFPYPTVTIRHLLAHTSGVPGYGILFDSIRLAHPDTIFTNAAILPGYRDVKPPLDFQPGENGSYQNTNFILLALIIEKVSGMPYKHYIHDNIFKPAKITHTVFPSFPFYHYTPAERKNLTQTYYRPRPYSDAVQQPDTVPFVSRYWYNYNFNGFGELLSTTDDLLKYDQALYNGKLLQDKTLQQAFIPVRLNDGRENPVGNGLGWQVDKDSTLGKTVLHGGGGFGLSAVLMRNVTQQQTVIIIDNMHPQSSLFVNAMGRSALKILNGQTVVPPARSFARVCGTLVVSKGPQAAQAFFKQHQTDTVHYDISEDEMNNMGYALMNDNKLDHALEIFSMNTKLFPYSFNVFDSYGEALLAKGRKQEALEMYRKSLVLKPDSPSGLDAVKKITETMK